MKLLFQGGHVVSASGVNRMDVLVEDELVAAVAPTLSCPDATVVDVTGKLLFPGFLDAHTHFDLDVANTTTADDFQTGTRAAVRGGTTTIIDFACPNKGETLSYGLQLWHEKADGKSACDYGFHMTIDDWNEGIRREIPDMIAAGIPTFKMYMTYPAMMIGDRDLYCALVELKKFNAFAGVHCENAGVIDALIAEKLKKGETAPASHPATRPNALEAEAVGSLLRMAQVADAPVMIVHLSTKEALEEVRAARARGQTVYVETCPQYLLLDRSRYENEDYSMAARYVCAPPLRDKADQDALWKAPSDGTIQSGLYQAACAQYGLEAVAPDAAIQALVMSIIYDEIKQGERGSREKFAAIDKAMRQAGCDCAILACTELSVFRTYHNLPPFYVDAMEVLAETAVTRCGYQLRTI